MDIAGERHGVMLRAARAGNLAREFATDRLEARRSFLFRLWEKRQAADPHAVPAAEPLT